MPKFYEESIHLILKEAIDTLKRLPSAKLKSRLIHWPDVIKQSAEILSALPSSSRPTPPDPKAIDRLDMVLDMLLKLDARERRLVWAKSCKISWQKLALKEGLSHMTLRKLHKIALLKLEKLLFN